MLHHYILRAFTTYSISREIHIKSVILATTRVTIITLVWIAYLGSLDLNLKNAYQKSCPVDGAVTIKVKGHLSTKGLPDSAFAVPAHEMELYRRTFDAEDLIHPPFGDSDGSFLAVTNLLITPNQTRGICASKNLEKSKCTTDKDCSKGLQTSEGMLTGACDTAVKFCQLKTWCPVQEDAFPLKKRVPLLRGVANFTLLIKNSVSFPDCGKDLGHFRNIVDTFPSDYLKYCRHLVGKDDLCPIFRLEDVVEWSGHNFSKVAVTGGIFKIELVWKCDFDWGFTKNPCFPKYQFARIDENTDISPGFNIRESFYHEENLRTLMKMYGIKFLIVVSGEGKKFDAFQLALAFGATIALFDLAPVVCDSMFHFFCFLKRFKPFQAHFGDFSAKARYSDGHKDVYDGQKQVENEAASDGTRL